MWNVNCENRCQEMLPPVKITPQKFAPEKITPWEN